MTAELTLSASQMDKVFGCAKAAAFHYVDKIRPAGFSEASKELGKRIHKILQLYVDLGTEPDDREMIMHPVRNPHTGETTHRPVFPGQIAAAAFPYLKKGPDNGTWLSETKIDGLRLTSGIRLQGDIDLAALTEQLIIDFKTTSDFKYALDVEGLLSNVQSNFYGYGWFEAVKRGAIPGSGASVDLAWIYLLTKGRARGQCVRATLTKERNDAEIARIDEVAKPWAQIRLNLISGHQLPPTGLATGHCEKYLGCPYRGIQCRPTLEETLTYGVGKKMDLATLLNQATQTQQAQASFPAPAGMLPVPSNPFGALAAPITAQNSGVQRPAFWMPGDAQNEMQEFAASKGHPLSKIASLADNPPPAEVGAQYDTAPKVEAGIINPHQANGMIPAANPEIAAALAGQHVGPLPTATPTTADAGEADFAALKARAQALGILPEGKNLKTAGIKKLLAEHDAKAFASELANFPVAQPSNPFPAFTPPSGSADPAPSFVRTTEAAYAETAGDPSPPDGVLVHVDRLRELESCEKIVIGLRAFVAAFR